MQRLNQPFPISVLVKEALRGRMPVRMTSIPPRATMSTICRIAAKIAINPRIMTRIDPRLEAAGLVVSAKSASIFCSKQAPSPSTSHLSDASMIQSANESDAVTSRPTIVVPAPATTTRVRRLFTISRPGSARCSQAMRAPPIMTEITAAAPIYHQRLDCRKRTAPAESLGAEGIRPATRALAPEISTTALSTSPTCPTPAKPSPERIEAAILAPRMKREITATARLIHVT